MEHTIRPASPKRGELWLVNFDPTIGSEIRKTRPAIILQNDTANRYSPVTIVAAITTRTDESTYPTEVPLAPTRNLKNLSVILLNQIRTIDKRRIVKKLGSVKPDIMHAVDRALKISLALNE